MTHVVDSSGAGGQVDDTQHDSHPTSLPQRGFLDEGPGGGKAEGNRARLGPLMKKSPEVTRGRSAWLTLLSDWAAQSPNPKCLQSDGLS